MATTKQKASARKYRNTRKTKLAFHHYNLLRTYGITLAQKEEMFGHQLGLCGLCYEALPDNILECCTDHDHKTGQVRALIHRRCNIIVGMIEKNPHLHSQAIRYIKRFRESLP